jgi:hypothetical protein
MGSGQAIHCPPRPKLEHGGLSEADLALTAKIRQTHPVRGDVRHHLRDQGIIELDVVKDRVRLLLGLGLMHFELGRLGHHRNLIGRDRRLQRDHIVDAKERTGEWIDQRLEELQR